MVRNLTGVDLNIFVGDIILVHLWLLSHFWRFSNRGESSLRNGLLLSRYNLSSLLSKFYFVVPFLVKTERCISLIRNSRA